MNIFLSTIDQITMCNMKGATCGDKPTDNYNPTLQFPLALQSVLMFSANCFGFMARKLFCCAGSLYLFSSYSVVKPTICYLLSTKQYIDKVSV